MAEDSDAEKTEPASAKRLEQAREEGDVPRSREVATFTVLMAAGCCLWLFGEGVVRRLSAAMVSGLALDRDQIFDADVLLLRIANDVGTVLLSCLPQAIVVMAVALASPLLARPSSSTVNLGTLTTISIRSSSGPEILPA